LLRDLYAENIVVQPCNRGTAIGVLLPTLHIAARDPDARILILPSDHFVADEPALVRAMARALSAIRDCARGVALLGIEAQDADPELGYIVADNGRHAGLRRVRRFVEKPTLQEARRLIRDEALWNSFILVCRARSLIELIARRFPDVVRKLEAAVREEAEVGLLYQDLPALDFSQDIATGQEHLLSVMPVPRCGWSDLGTPRRLAQTLALRSKYGTQCAAIPSELPCNRIDLSERIAQVHPALLRANASSR
jgi:mannose-1-phosphate guanylyltransferase